MIRAVPVSLDGFFFPFMPALFFIQGIEQLNLLNSIYVVIRTVAPRYGDAFEEDQEQQTHPAGGVVVEQFEHVDSALVTQHREQCYQKEAEMQYERDITWEYNRHKDGKQCNQHI